MVPKRRHNNPFTSLILAFLIALLATTGAFAGPPAQEAQPPEEIRLDQDDAGSQVALNEQQVLVVDLQANPSTGYSWLVMDMDAAVLAHDPSTDVWYEEMRSGRVGAPVRQMSRFHCVAVGRSALVLEYRRPWQREEPPVASFSVTVECLASLRVPLVPMPPEPAPAAVPPAAAEPEVGALALPSHFNWCEQYPCPPIRDQGECGSCWAFATVGVLEIAIRVKDGITRDLSEQYLVSCNTDGWGCVYGGGWAHNYHWWKAGLFQNAAGAVYESDFPYRARDVTCPGPFAHHEKIVGWAYVAGGEETMPTTAAIKQALYERGPLAVMVCAGFDFTSYTGGVFATDESWYCGDNLINHGVILTGWDDAQQIWYLRNSWGTGWGESGWMRIRWGTSRVGLMASYITYGNAANAVYLPIVRKALPFLPLRNGNFEQGRTAWVEYSFHGWPLIVQGSALPGDVRPHSGSWAVWLGGEDDDISYIEQQVTVPAGSPYLHYWHWIASADACGYDFGGVIINDTVVVDVYDLCDRRNTRGWVRHTVDLRAYAGQNVYLQIRAETDRSRNSNLFVDDVSFQSWGAVGAAEVAPSGETTLAEEATKSELLQRMSAAGVEHKEPRLFPLPPPRP